MRVAGGKMDTHAYAAPCLAVVDTHYKRTFYRRHRVEICCAALVAALVAMVTAMVLSIVGMR